MKNIFKLILATLLLSGCSTVSTVSGTAQLADTSDIKNGMTIEQVYQRLGKPLLDHSNGNITRSWNRIMVDSRAKLNGDRTWYYKRTSITRQKTTLGLIFLKGKLIEKKNRN